MTYRAAVLALASALAFACGPAEDGTPLGPDGGAVGSTDAAPPGDGAVPLICSAGCPSATCLPAASGGFEQHGPSSCVAGECTAPVVASCGTLRCAPAGTVCLTSCLGNDDCVAGTGCVDGACAPLTDADGDGFGAWPGGDCDDADPTIYPGAAEVCDGRDQDCDAAADEDFDADGDGYRTCWGDCNDVDPTIHDGAEELVDGIDNDCNGLVDDNTATTDDDGDGWTDAAGDCDDAAPLVNPGAVEVTGDLVDNDCDGAVDEPPAPCDAGLGTTALDFAKSIELCSNVTAASFAAPSHGDARAIVPNWGTTYGPHAGSAMTTLASGLARDADTGGYVVPQSGTNFGISAGHPDPIGAVGCSSADPGTVYDYVELSLTIQVPSNAYSFSFDFNFMSAEYPEWVCTSFDDTFLALLTSSAFTGNISFDSLGNRMSINNGFFTVCPVGSTPGCTGSGELGGTGYEGSIGGGTGWLTTTAPVVAGETITLRFIVFDEGDNILDSAVLLDNFRWSATPVDDPVTGRM